MAKIIYNLKFLWKMILGGAKVKYADVWITSLIACWSGPRSIESCFVGNNPASVCDIIFNNQAYEKAGIMLSTSCQPLKVISTGEKIRIK